MTTKQHANNRGRYEVLISPVRRERFSHYLIEGITLHFVRGRFALAGC